MRGKNNNATYALQETTVVMEDKTYSVKNKITFRMVKY